MSFRQPDLPPSPLPRDDPSVALDAAAGAVEDGALGFDDVLAYAEQCQRYFKNKVEGLEKVIEINSNDNVSNTTSESEDENEMEKEEVNLD